tara:strand:+ start:231 stop:926 length:696 start_codon:yes stop_codon:yes gene_type:complete
MKKLILSAIAILMIVVATSSIKAQVVNVENLGRNSTYGKSIRFTNPVKTVDGSIYLFSNWNNRSVVTSKAGETFSLSNVNFNLQRNRFVSKISRDSIFVLSMNEINSIKINNKTFKRVVTDELGGRVFEVVFEYLDVSILKFYSIKFVGGSVNPMLGRSTDKLIHKKELYLLLGDEIHKFKLNKKSILKNFATNKSHGNEWIKYYSKNGLSFRSIEDLKTSLKYFMYSINN